jgi:hypothetical protein
VTTANIHIWLPRASVGWKRILLRVSVFLIVVVLGCWAASYRYQTQTQVAFGDYRCDLTVVPGTVSLTLFRDVAEDEFYRHVEVPLWMLSLSPLAGVVACRTWIARDRWRASVRGFDVR